MTMVLLVLTYLAWNGLLVGFYIWLGSRRHWQRYDRERATFTRDHQLLLTALRWTAHYERKHR